MGQAHLVHLVYLAHLVHLVHLVYLVHLIHQVQNRMNLEGVLEKLSRPGAVQTKLEEFGKHEFGGKM